MANKMQSHRAFEICKAKKKTIKRQNAKFKLKLKMRKVKIEI